MARSKPVPKPIVVTVAQAAEMLGCSRQNVYNLFDRGVLRRTNIAGTEAVRIPIEDVYAAVGLEAPAA